MFGRLHGVEDTLVERVDRVEERGKRMIVAVV
jgi:hypothetical protein